VYKVKIIKKTLAIITETPKGWLVDDFQYLNYVVNDIGYFYPLSYMAHQYGLENINTKEEEKFESAPVDKSENILVQQKKRKKRKHCLNHGELKMLDYHSKHSTFMMEAKEALVKSAELYFKEIIKKKNTPKVSADVIYTLNVNDAKISKPNHLLLEDNANYEDITNKFASNDKYTCVKVRSNKQEFIIPPLSSFFISDFKHLSWLSSFGKRYDLVVMDPPWENKSVKRSKKYNYLPEYDLKKICMNELLSNDGIVVIWVTNKQKYIEFVKNILFPHWNLKIIAHWHWIKLTVSGDYVFPMESTHKKPYEALLIAKRECSRISLCFDQVICSIPIPSHSRKPSLKSIFSSILSDKANCLELFARNLTPGWTSWGNEVLKFQNIEYFCQSSQKE